MKIDIKKAFRCLTSFAVIAVVVLCSVCTPAEAVFAPGFVAYQPKDYIDSTIIVGDVKTVQYSFSGFDAHFLTVNNDITKTFTGTIYTHEPAAGSMRSDINIYPINKRPSLTYALSENTIDVRDLVPGAVIEFSMQLSYRLEYWSDYENTYTARMRSCVCCYDEDGNYMSQVVSEWETRNIQISELGAASTFTVASSVALPSGTAYISPYLNTSLVYGPWPDGDNAIEIYSDRILITTDINMIEDSTETMHAVKDSLDDISDKMDGVSDKLDDVTGELGDIESGIGGVSDKLDDVTGELEDIGDKVDEIISGGAPGAELEEESDKLDDTGDAIGDAMSDYKDASSSLPTTPPGVGGYVDSGAVGDAVASAGDFLDWEKSGLSKMYVPMGLSVSFSLLFYIIFGKKG